MQKLEETQVMMTCRSDALGGSTPMIHEREDNKQEGEEEEDA